MFLSKQFGRGVKWSECFVVVWGGVSERWSKSQGRVVSCVGAIGLYTHSRLGENYIEACRRVVLEDKNNQPTSWMLGRRAYVENPQ